MAGMGPMAGGPMAVMGDPNAMAGPSFQMMNSVEDPKAMLPTFIYDFFRKSGRAKLATAMLSEPDSSGVKLRSKTSPSRQVNGASVAKAADGKELPEAMVPEDLPDSSFLEDWFCQFLDMYNASVARDKSQANSNLYWMHATAQRKLAMQGNQNMVQTGMSQPGNYQRMMQQQGAGMMASHLQQKVGNNVRPGMMQAGQYGVNMRNMQQLSQAPMQRGGSGMDSNNQGQSPMSGDNAPSPKRQRLEGGAQMNRPGTDPNAQINQLKYAQELRASTQGKMQEIQNMGQMGMQQASPMNAGDMAVDTFGGFGAPNMSRSVSGPANNQQAGGALADYQMQLMLLEQQNKKRLMMARQEQENTGPPVTRPDGTTGGPHTPLNQNAFGQAMAASQGNRNGQSPNNADQAKRGTPKVGQGSPLPDGLPGSRVSPAPGNFENHAMQQNLANQFMNQQGQMGQNGAIMRPPSSNPMGNPQMYSGMSQQQMEALSRNGRMPNGANWPTQMMPNQVQMPQQGPDQQRNNMPPPQGPVPGGANAGKPSPPQQNNGNPPTPSQTNKAAPNAKKKKEETKKKPAKKGANTTGQTPNSEAEQPATPTTPMHPASFSGQGQKPPGAQQNNQQQSQQQGQPQQGQPQQSQTQQPPSISAGQGGPVNDAVQPDHGMNAGAPFGNIGDQANDMSFIGDFQPIGGGEEVLDGFDFDSFLIDPESGSNWDIGGDPQFINGEGLDAGAGP